ncbi:MAG: DUF983 domain-containing protein [Acidimicrobiales bacterium]|nr:DUF983 domain-containing protein [Acidimicrobiales bacterium]
MERSFGVDDVLAGKASPWTLLRRGCAKHCPRCGGGDLFTSWFRMKDRCPTCGYLFEREPGFFLGSYFINFMIAEGFLFVLAMVFVVAKASHPDTGLAVPVSVGVAIAIVGPVVFYPYSRTIWSAFDLMMIPLEIDEIVEAADAVGGGEASPEEGPGGDGDGDGGAPPGG